MTFSDLKNRLLVVQTYRLIDTFESIIKFLCSVCAFVRGIKSNCLFQFIVLWNIPISNFLAGNKTRLSLENVT